MKYIKKPVVIEAMQFDGQDVNAIIKFTNGLAHTTLPPTGYYLVIPTLEGVMKVAPRDWVIKGIKDEFYPCKPDIFEATYEKVED
jgi:hypothetical protein